jgi:hypothetical protein
MSTRFGWCATNTDAATEFVAPAIFSEVMAMTTAIMPVEAMATMAGAPGITVAAPATVIMAAARALGSVSEAVVGSRNIVISRSSERLFFVELTQWTDGARVNTQGTASFEEP